MGEIKSEVIRRNENSENERLDLIEDMLFEFFDVNRIKPEETISICSGAIIKYFIQIGEKKDFHEYMENLVKCYEENRKELNLK